MKFIDILTGRPVEDAKDKPSGVKLLVEPSTGLLAIIDDFRKGNGETREAAMLACAALGAVSKKVVGGLFDALTGGRGSKPRPDDELAAEKAELDAKQFVLTKALAKKEVLKEAVEACEQVAQETLERDPDAPTPEYADAAISCANAVRTIMTRVVEEVDEAFKKAPTLVDFKRVVGSAAQRECHYKDRNAGVDCRQKFTDKDRWHHWCASCVCRHALPEIWGTT